MDWLNYHHLLYFWVVAREGSIARACEHLHVAQPTISGQIAQLERSLGAKLFQRVGRNLKLTDTGRTVYGYAEEIFSLGRELTDVVKGRPAGRPIRFVVGAADVLSKLVVFRLIRPAFELPNPVRVICHEGRFEQLLADLATHSLDLVLSDTPILPAVHIKAYSHLLGHCGVSFFAAPQLAARYRRHFPASLDDAPLLMPGETTTLRRALDQWFDEQSIRPEVVAEFQDSALLKVVGQEGLGIFPAPSAIRGEIERQYRVKHVGTLDAVRERFYAISVERRLKHPAVLAITQAARTDLFAASPT